MQLSSHAPLPLLLPPTASCCFLLPPISAPEWRPWLLARLPPACWPSQLSTSPVRPSCHETGCITAACWPAAPRARPSWALQPQPCVCTSARVWLQSHQHLQHWPDPQPGERVGGQVGWFFSTAGELGATQSVWVGLGDWMRGWVRMWVKGCEIVCVCIGSEWRKRLCVLRCRQHSGENNCRLHVFAGAVCQELTACIL